MSRIGTCCRFSVFGSASIPIDALSGGWSQQIAMRGRLDPGGRWENRELTTDDQAVAVSADYTQSLAEWRFLSFGVEIASRRSSCR